MGIKLSKEQQACSTNNRGSRNFQRVFHESIGLFDIQDICINFPLGLLRGMVMSGDTQ